MNTCTCINQNCKEDTSLISIIKIISAGEKYTWYSVQKQAESN